MIKNSAPRAFSGKWVFISDYLNVMNACDASFRSVQGLLTQHRLYNELDLFVGDYLLAPVVVVAPNNTLQDRPRFCNMDACFQRNLAVLLLNNSNFLSISVVERLYETCKAHSDDPITLAILSTLLQRFTPTDENIKEGKNSVIVKSLDTAIDEKQLLRKEKDQEAFVPWEITPEKSSKRHERLWQSDKVQPQRKKIRRNSSHQQQQQQDEEEKGVGVSLKEVNVDGDDSMRIDDAKVNIIPDALVLHSTEAKLDDETVSSLDALGKVLMKLNQSEEQSTDAELLKDMRHHLMTLRNLPPTLAPQAYARLNIAAMDEKVVCVLCNLYLDKLLSINQCKTFLNICFCPIVQRLDRPASRFLYTTVMDVAKVHPKAVIEGLLVPLLQSDDVGSAQFEVINRVAKECLPPTMMILFLRLILLKYAHVQWTDHTFKLLCTLMNSKLMLLPNDPVHVAMCQQLTTVCTMLLDQQPGAVAVISPTKSGNIRKKKNTSFPAVKQISNSLAFSTMLHTFVSKYKIMARPLKKSLLMIAPQLTTMLKKAIVSLCKKL